MLCVGQKHGLKPQKIQVQQLKILEKKKFNKLEAAKLQGKENITSWR